MNLALTTHPAIDAVMASAASLLGMEVIFIGGLTEETFTFERVHTSAQWPGFQDGVSTPRNDSLCSLLLAGGAPHSSDVPNDPMYSQAGRAVEAGVTSYVGVPVRDDSGSVVATLCGVDRGAVEVSDETLEVLTSLADVVAAHLGPMVKEGVVIRRAPEGGWAVGDGQAPGERAGDLTSAMVLADLLATDLTPAGRPPRQDRPQDEIGRLRLSVTQLEHALAARVIVEQAIGVLSERQHSSSRQAFERLRKVARSRGRKVHDLSREVVLSASDPAVPLPPELAGPR